MVSFHITYVRTLREFTIIIATPYSYMSYCTSSRKDRSRGHVMVSSGDRRGQLSTVEATGALVIEHHLISR